MSGIDEGLLNIKGSSAKGTYSRSTSEDACRVEGCWCLQTPWLAGEIIIWTQKWSLMVCYVQLRHGKASYEHTRLTNSQEMTTTLATLVVGIDGDDWKGNHYNCNPCKTDLYIL